IIFLTEIKCRYKFRLPLPRTIMTVNPTDKPELSRKVEDIHDFSITILITNSKQLVDTAQITTKLDLSPKLEELTSYIKDNIPDIAIQVSITDYNTATQMIRAIQDHFNFTLIPNYLIDLPDLP
ncbi:24503_t:CDS:2, partial [Gigaspora margarita]